MRIDPAGFPFIIGAVAAAVLAALTIGWGFAIPLLVVAGAVAVSAAFRLEDHGVAVVGSVPPPEESTPVVFSAPSVAGGTDGPQPIASAHRSSARPQPDESASALGCMSIDLRHLHASMVGWIRSFSNEMYRRTGRHPVIYTTTRWWNTCTGSSRAFASNHALWLARPNSEDAGALPAGWSFWTFWQYGSSGSLPGDQNLFNGSAAQLKQFARGR